MLITNWVQRKDWHWDLVADGAVLGTVIKCLAICRSDTYGWLAYVPAVCQDCPIDKIDLLDIYSAMRQVELFALYSSTYEREL